MFSDSNDHPLRYLFIDFNSYFAAVEQLDDLALRGRPVMVIPLASDYSGAIAVSYEAKALGVRRGTSSIEARELCPDIAIRVARHDRYVAVHKMVMAEIERHLPIAKIFSIDECACRLDVTEQKPALARTVARRIKFGISSNIGKPLRSSIGIAASSLLAKLAAERHKPDGLTILKMQDLPHALDDMPIEAVPGIGTAMSMRLRRAGLGRFPDLWRLAPKHARALWGSVSGERLVYALHGHDILDDAPVQKKSIGHSRVLSAPWNRADNARIVARALLLKAASRLRLYGLYAGGLSLHIQCRPTGGAGKDATWLPPTQNSWQLLRRLDKLWNEALPCGHNSNTLFRTVGITLHRLSPSPPAPDLFTPASYLESEQRGADLWRQIDQINRRHQRGTVTLASQHAMDLDYLGVKIAFSRVPDEQEFEC